MRNRRKTLCLYILICTLICVVGCGTNNNVSDNTDNKKNAFISTEKYINDIQGELICSDFYDVYYIVTEDDKYYYMNVYNQKDDRTNSFQLNVSEGMKIRTICVRNSIYAILADESENHYLARFNMKGEGESIKELDSVKENGFNRLISDDGSNIYFSNGTDITIFNSELSYIGTIEEHESRIISAAVNESGELSILIEKNNSNNVYLEPDYYIGVIDLKTHKIKNKTKVDGEIVQGRTLIDSYIYDGCIRLSDGIYSFENDKLIKKLDYNYSFLSIDGTERFISVEDETFTAVEMNDGKCFIRTFFKADEKIFDDKKIITFGCFGQSDIISESIADFNLMSDSIFVEIKDYGTDKEGVTRFNLDITSGNGPDVFAVGGYQSVNKLIKNGICENLDSYIKDDNGINKDDFITEYIDSTEYNGSLYMISDSFMVSTLITKKNGYLSEFNCTSDEFDKYIESARPDARMFYMDLTKAELLALFMDNALNYYIDYEKGEIHLNTIEFRHLLKICNDNGVSDDELSYKEMSEVEYINAYRNGEALFAFDPTISSLKQLEIMYGDDICICGYPDMGSFFVPVEEICMNSKSDNQDAAWEVMRYFLSKEHQYEMISKHYETIPTRKDVYEELKNRLSSTENYIDDYGNEMKTLDQPVELGYIEKYDDLIKNTDKYVDTNFELEKIIFEEATLFFSGEHEIDISIELMENRVNTYLKEQE